MFLHLHTTARAWDQDLAKMCPSECGIVAQMDSKWHVFVYFSFNHPRSHWLPHACTCCFQHHWSSRTLTEHCQWCSHLSPKSGPPVSDSSTADAAAGSEGSANNLLCLPFSEQHCQYGLIDWLVVTCFERFDNQPLQNRCRCTTARLFILLTYPFKLLPSTLSLI